MNDRIDIPDWYQVDFDMSSYKQTLVSISGLVIEFKKQGLIDKWFYLFEGKTIRVRFHSQEETRLGRAMGEMIGQFGLTISPELPFQRYWETTDAFTTLEVAEAFANIMAELTQVTIMRLDKPGQFSNYKLVERLSHCIFNNVYGSPTEEYFLLKRLLERYGNSLGNINDNPEQTFLDAEQKHVTTNASTISLPTMKIPTK